MNSIVLAVFALIGSVDAAPAPHAMPNADQTTRQVQPENVISCKSCKRSFDKENHNGYCPFCGANNNQLTDAADVQDGIEITLAGSMLPFEEAKSSIDIQWTGSGYRFTNNHGSRSIKVKVTQIANWISTSFALAPGKSQFVAWKSYSEVTAKFVSPAAHWRDRIVPGPRASTESHHGSTDRNALRSGSGSPDSLAALSSPARTPRLRWFRGSSAWSSYPPKPG